MKNDNEVKKAEALKFLIRADVERSLPASTDKCRQDIRWVYGQPIEAILMFQKVQQETYFELKKSKGGLSNEEVFLISSLKSAYELRRFVNKKSINQIDDIEELRIIQKLNISKHRPNRKQAKREWLLNHKSEIEAMLAAEYSTRAMSKYFLSKHRFNVSHTLINNFIKNQKEL